MIPFTLDIQRKFRQRMDDPANPGVQKYVRKLGWLFLTAFVLMSSLAQYLPAGWQYTPETSGPSVTPKKHTFNQPVPPPVCTIPVVNLVNVGTGPCAGVASLSVSSDQPISRLDWYQGNTLVMTSYPQAVTAGTTVAGGSQGSGAGQLFKPYGVFVDGAGAIYIGDRGNNRVQKWAAGATSGTTVAGGKGAGSGADQLDEPAGVYVDAAGAVYAPDRNNYRVQKWAAGATSGTTVAGGNGKGDQPHQLNNPIAVFVDAAGAVYVVDQGNNRVQKWAAGATSGTTVAGGNGSGSGAGQLNTPFGLFVDEAGTVYIGDRENSRVQKWTPGATTGITVAGGNGPGSGATQLKQPFGVYVDAAGAVYVCEQDNYRVQKWAAGATSGTTVAGGNGWGNGASQLADPNSVFVDVSGAMYIADNSNNRIQKWVGSSSLVYKPLSSGNFTVKVTSVDGCTAITNSVTVAPLSVSVTASPGLTITSGSSATLTASGANTYIWSNGSTENPLLLSNVTSATTLSVTGITGACSATASAAISVTANPCAGIGNRIYVKSGGTGNGASWDQATGDLQAAINNSCGATEIWVAQGTYKPAAYPEGCSSCNSARDYAFTLKSDIKVYGGFAGTETNLTDRNPDSYTTILSGDIGTPDDAGDNCHHVVVSADNPAGTVLDGFTITGANANGSGYVGYAGKTLYRSFGGGLQIFGGSPSVACLHLAENQGSIAGLYLEGTSSLTLSYCSFSKNTATAYDYATVYDYASSDLTVDHCTFTDSQAGDGGATYFYATNGLILNECSFCRNTGNYAGAAYFNYAENVTVNACTFDGNTAADSDEGYGGAVYIDDSDGPFAFAKCKFTNNMAAYGGGLLINDTYATLTVTNCLFSGNTATANQKAGGAVYLYAYGANTFINCTFSTNNASNGSAGGVYAYYAPLNVTNSVFWGNTQELGTPDQQQLMIDGNETVTIKNSLIQDGLPAGVTDDGNNLSSDPLFADVPNGNYRLTACSPALNAGDNTANTTATDLAGNTRVANTTIDLGAYEFQGSPASLTVAVTASPSLTVTNGGSVTLTASGATSYTWSNGSTVNPLIISGLTTTTVLSVTGVTSGGCSATASAAVSVTQVPVTSLCIETSTGVLTSFSATGTTNGAIEYQSVDGDRLYRDDLAVCCGGSGMIWRLAPATGSPIGIAANYGYWTNDDGSVYLPMSDWKGVYTNVGITLTEGSCPCSLTVDVTPSSQTITAGSSVTLTASGADSYLWSNGSTDNPLVLTNVTVAGTLSVTGTKGACSATASAGVSMDCDPTQTAKAYSLTQTGVLSPATCSVQLTGKGYGTGYVMTGPDGYVFSTVYRRADAHTVRGAAVSRPGTYTLTVSFTSACGITSSEVVTYVVTGTACQ